MRLLPHCRGRHPGFRQRNKAEPDGKAAAVDTSSDPRIAALLAGIVCVDEEPVAGKSRWKLEESDYELNAFDNLRCDCDPATYMWQATFRDEFATILNGQTKDKSPIPGCSADPNEHTLPSRIDWSAFLDQATCEQWMKLQGGDSD